MFLFLSLSSQELDSCTIEAGDLRKLSYIKDCFEEVVFHPEEGKHTVSTLIALLDLFVF